MIKGGDNIGVIRYFRRSTEGYLNKIERRYDKEKGEYIRKRFDNGFLANCYSDFIMIFEAILHGLKPQSYKSRKLTEARRYREFNKRGFPVPKLLEEGDGYIDIEYIRMRELSISLRDINESKQKKLELTREAAAEIKKIHDTGFELGDANVHNVAFTPDGRIILFDFEHQLINGSREKDYSVFAISAVYENPDPLVVKDILKSIAEGYGEDLTHKIIIVPYAYLVFIAENRLRNLYELAKAKRYRARRLQNSTAQGGG